MTHVVIFGQFAYCVVHSTITSKRSKAKRPTNRRPLLYGKGVHSKYSSRLPIVVCNACVSMLTILLVICLPPLYSYTLFLCVSHSPTRYQPNKKELGSQFSNLSLHVRTHACTHSKITNTVGVMRSYVTAIVNMDIVKEVGKFMLRRDKFRNESSCGSRCIVDCNFGSGLDEPKHGMLSKYRGCLRCYVISRR
jgi:hypothetical protein